MSSRGGIFSAHQKFASALSEFNAKKDSLTNPLIISKDINEKGAKKFHVTNFKEIYFRPGTIRNFYEVSNDNFKVNLFLKNNEFSNLI